MDGGIAIVGLISGVITLVQAIHSAASSLPSTSQHKKEATELADRVSAFQPHLELIKNSPRFRNAQTEGLIERFKESLEESQNFIESLGRGGWRIKSVRVKFDELNQRIDRYRSDLVLLIVSNSSIVFRTDDTGTLPSLYVDPEDFIFGAVLGFQLGHMTSIFPVHDAFVEEQTKLKNILNEGGLQVSIGADTDPLRTLFDEFTSGNKSGQAAGMVIGYSCRLVADPFGCDAQTRQEASDKLNWSELVSADHREALLHEFVESKPRSVADMIACVCRVIPFPQQSYDTEHGKDGLHLGWELRALLDIQEGPDALNRAIESELNESENDDVKKVKEFLKKTGNEDLLKEVKYGEIMERLAIRYCVKDIVRHTAVLIGYCARTILSSQADNRLAGRMMHDVFLTMIHHRELLFSELVRTKPANVDKLEETLLKYVVQRSRFKESLENNAD